MKICLDFSAPVWSKKLKNRDWKIPTCFTIFGLQSLKRFLKLGERKTFLSTIWQRNHGFNRISHWLALHDSESPYDCWVCGAHCLIFTIFIRFYSIFWINKKNVVRWRFLKTIFRFWRFLTDFIILKLDKNCRFSNSVVCMNTF